MVTKSQYDTAFTFRKKKLDNDQYLKAAYDNDYFAAKEAHKTRIDNLGLTTSLWTFPLSSSVISYENGKGQFNPCSHTKQIVDFPGTRKPFYRTIVFENSKYWSFTTHCFMETMTPSFYESLIGNQITDQLRSEAWAELYPQLNDGFSLANFLWEIKEIPQLIPQIYKIGRKMLRALQSKPGLSTKTYADAHLTASFGLIPSYSDLEWIVSNLLNTNKILNKFIDDGKEVKPYHHRKWLARETEKFPTYIGWQDNELSSLYAATAKISYVYEKPTDWEAFMRIWGLELSMERIWNAIPYSFIVDWILKIGDYLRRFDEDPNLVSVKVHDYCDSIKEISTRKAVYSAVTSTWSITPWSDFVFKEKFSYEPSNEKEMIWTMSKSQYLRVPGNPYTGFSFPVSDTLSARELVLGGALLRTSISH